MNSTPIQSTKIYEAVFNRLMDGIKSGEFPPGSKLPSVRQLSIDWQVGQAAVREALSALKAMNLIVSRQGEGTFVSQYTPDQTFDLRPLMKQEEIQSLLELRLVLESGSIRLAAQRRTEPELEELRGILDRMKEDMKVPGVGEQSDWDFHYSLSRASKNPYFVSLMESLGEQIQMSLLSSRLAMYQVDGEPQKLMDQHGAILDAVAKQDPDAAQSAMVRHLRHVESILKSMDEQIQS